MRCWWSFSESWSLTLLLNNLCHHPFRDLQGVIVSAHQLIAPSLFTLAIWLVSSCPGETGLLHLPTWPSLPHLHDRFSLFCLLSQHVLLLVIVPAGLLHLPFQPGLPHLPVQPGTPHLPVQLGTPHLPVQPGTPHLPVQPGTPHLPGWTGRLHLFVSAGLLLVV